MDPTHFQLSIQIYELLWIWPKRNQSLNLIHSRPAALLMSRKQTAFARLSFGPSYYVSYWAAR